MTDSDEVKLLPCPWCSEAWIKVRSENSACFYGECQGCAAHGSEASTRAEAIAAWNTRPPVVTDEVVERVARAIYKSAQDYALQNAPKNAKLPTWESEDQEARDVMASMARAALASMPAVVSGGQGPAFETDRGKSA